MTNTTSAAKPGFYDTLMLTDRAACARAIRWGGIAATVNALWAAAFAGYCAVVGAERMMDGFSGVVDIQAKVSEAVKRS